MDPIEQIKVDLEHIAKLNAQIDDLQWKALKGCPICGKDDLAVYSGLNVDVKCNGCDLVLSGYPDVVTAILKWNERVF